MNQNMTASLLNPLRNALGVSVGCLAALGCLLLFSATGYAQEEDDFTLASYYHDAMGNLVDEDDDGFFAALLHGTPTLNLRLAHEYSSLDNTTSPGRALTLRTRINYKTREWADFQGFAQYQVINRLNDDYSIPGGRGGDPNRDGVADVHGERFHQAYLDYLGIENTVLRGGLQEVVLDDARLIGNVGWRQNAQSFRGFSARHTIGDVKLFGAYLDDVLNIHNEHNPDVDHVMLFNANWQASETLNVTGFAYYLDAEAAALDSATYGARLKGLVEAVSFDVTIASQDGYADGPRKGGYMVNAYAKAKTGPVWLGIGYSRISGQEGGDQPFDTLFSTAHKFNGWADQFLATNGGGVVGGVEDTFFEISTKVGKGKFLARAHIFHTTDPVGGFEGEYGRELDLLFVQPLAEDLKALVKVALYDKTHSPAGVTRDEEVTWLRLEYTF
jgi:hypothetical protein